MKSAIYEDFKSKLIRSFQEAYGVDSPEVSECRRILETPTGELIVRAALSLHPFFPACFCILQTHNSIFKTLCQLLFVS